MVTTTADSGTGSLRQAILNANATAGADVIDFNIPGSGVQTIAAQTPLPAITETVTVDGYSQPGSVVNSNATGGLNSVLRIELNGSALSGTGNGISVSNASSVFVEGLAINRFPEAQISMVGTTNSGVGGCYLGTNAAGTAAATSGSGAIGVLLDNSDGNLVGAMTAVGFRNLISGNSTGVSVFDGSDSDAIEGNLIGTSRSGGAAVGNLIGGVFISGNSNTVGNHFAPSGRNVLSGNGNSGVILEDAGGTTIENNYLGTRASGRAALPNVSYGVLEITSHDTVIGGTTPAERNVIAANGHGGVTSFQGIDTHIHGNFIGVDATGQTA